MAGQEKQHVGDGQDNYAEAARQAANAVRQTGQETAKSAAQAGAEATGKAAASAVQASTKVGQATSQAAAGVAAGGPWGAVISAAWAARHTLMKVLVCICLSLLFLIVMIVSLPSIIFNNIFHTDPSTVDPNAPTDMYAIVEQMSGVVADCVQSGYDNAYAEVEKRIEDGGYDYDLSMEALIDYGKSSSDYDVCYIFAAYSAAQGQRGTTASDLQSKLNRMSTKMFPVTSEEQVKERVVPLVYTIYKEATVTVVTEKTQTGTINGQPQYRYTTATRTYYVPEATETSTEPITRPKYNSVTVDIPIYSDGTITGTKSETYYAQGESETLTPKKEMIRYLECTIHPFDQRVVYDAFGIDVKATYDQFQTTYGEAIQSMADSLKLTLYGSTGSGEVPVITDAELLAHLDSLQCSATRKEIIKAGLSLVGRVPYFWGGKSAPGWNDEWNTPKVVTAGGSSSSGQVRPYGLDCSGFTHWTYNTALGFELPHGSANQWSASTEISEEELLPGDLGFLQRPSDAGTNHVLIYAGKDASGNKLWVHCASSTGVVLNSPTYVKHYRRVNDIDLESEVVPGQEPLGEPLYTIDVHVTWYYACSKCCGSNADGYTASGKQAARGMVAMSSHYPFGTKLVIDGTTYIVEDRGGSGIESDITRVDIFTPSHQEALQHGRYWTKATFYRIGR